MKEELQKWWNNSEIISRKSPQKFKPNYDYELSLRERLVDDFVPNAIAITPEIGQGEFKVLGQNPDNPESCYIGNVKIEYNVNKIWLAKWKINGSTHYAYGMLVSPQILVFNFSYMDSDNQRCTGLVSYSFLSEKIVSGQWIEEGYSKRGIEELRKMEENEIDFDDGHDANWGFSLN